MAELLENGPAVLRRSPLAHLEEPMRRGGVGGSRAVSLRELPFLSMVSIRVDPLSAASGRMAGVLGAPLPQECGATSYAGPFSVFWLGPDEWLVVCPPDTEPVVPALLEALGDQPGSVVDVSANRTTVELSGPGALRVLETGCPLDLHPRSFAPGRAVTTTVGPVPVLLWQVDADTYRLFPRSSFADYLTRWLLDAMAELRVSEID
jgi:sarcosine oxidase subunit gamma